MQVDFYQLGGSVDPVLPRLAERVLGGGERLLVVTGDAAEAARLDALLWSYAPESFLPHGLAGEEGEMDQPVLLALAVAPTNAARFVMLADGVWREEALIGFERVFLLFGGDRLEAARGAWKALKGREGVERRYWQQDASGGWKQAG